eukprot:2657027-Ditylum_brightwellii.AAC.1
MPDAFSSPSSLQPPPPQQLDDSAQTSQYHQPLAPSLSTQSQSSQPTPDRSQFTRVDGIGLWNSWTRNFKTPLLALLDLLDNAFDAALAPPLLGDVITKTGVFNGKIHITSDVDLSNNGVITGMTITNNCARRIKPLKNIMEIYSSSKGKATESIGENGV